MLTHSKESHAPTNLEPGTKPETKPAEATVAEIEQKHGSKDLKMAIPRTEKVQRIGGRCSTSDDSYRRGDDGHR